MLLMPNLVLLLGSLSALASSFFACCVGPAALASHASPYACAPLDGTAHVGNVRCVGEGKREVWKNVRSSRDTSAVNERVNKRTISSVFQRLSRGIDCCVRRRPLAIPTA